MYNIVVTGGAGYIGSHTALLLLDKGYNVHIIDSLINGFYESIVSIKNIHENKNKNLGNKLYFYKCDIRNKELLRKVLKIILKKANNRIDALIHFAGLKSVNQSINQPIKYWNNNVLGSINLFEIMGEFNCENIIFSSSATVYGENNYRKIRESDQLKPINPYGFTKLAVENCLNDIFNSPLNNWGVIILRYFNPAGAHPSGLLGENFNGKPSNLFPFICEVADGKLDKITVFGNDWETFDGTCVRDYIHIMDLAEGHLSAIEYLLNHEKQFLTINLGTSEGVSVLNFIYQFQETNNIRINYEFGHRREGDSAFSVADSSKALEILGWRAKRTLSDICKDGWNRQKMKSYL